MTWKDRTEILLGKEALKKLNNSHVMVVGLGGVGGAAVEMLVRAGVGIITLVDHDKIEETNLNRQIIATKSNLNQKKTEAWAKRLCDINPDLIVYDFCFYLESSNLEEIFRKRPDYVVDAIDSVDSKVHLLAYCHERSIPVVSSMGSGFKLDPESVKIADIAETHSCSLAQKIRYKLRKLGINSGIKVVFSDEKNFNANSKLKNQKVKQNIGTISYMPNIFGCFCASVVIRDLLYKFDCK